MTDESEELRAIWSGVVKALAGRELDPTLPDLGVTDVDSNLRATAAYMRQKYGPTSENLT